MKKFVILIASLVFMTKIVSVNIETGKECEVAKGEEPCPSHIVGTTCECTTSPKVMNATVYQRGLGWYVKQ